MLAANLLLLVMTPSAVAETSSPFEIKSFSSRVTDKNEAAYTVAGGRPDQFTSEFTLRTASGGQPAEDPRDVSIAAPPGFLVNPVAFPRCPLNAFEDVSPVPKCPSDTQVGIVLFNGNTRRLFNVTPERGFPAQFAFIQPLYGTVSLYATLLPRTHGYRIALGSIDAAIGAGLSDLTAVLYGIPSQHVSSAIEAPFVSNPLDCSQAEPTFDIAVDSWQRSGARLSDGLPDLSDPFWRTASAPMPAVTDCDDPALASQWRPDVGVTPLQPGAGAIRAEQPTGLAVDLGFPQSNDPTDPNTTFEPQRPQAPEPKEITVKLPAGLAISPSAADGIAACSDQASDTAGDQVRYDTTTPVTCPDSSKIGSAVAITPLLAAHNPTDDHIIGPEAVRGDVYLLKPHRGDLPAGGDGGDGRFRVLLQLENARYGLNIKAPGMATADEQTGQLTARFEASPQLPASRIFVALKGGSRALLASPPSCGEFISASDIVPWSTPGTPDAHPTDSFNVRSSPDGSPCAPSPGARRFAPTMIAGTDSNAAGQSSPFTMHVTRQDGEQELGSLEFTTPVGLAAALKGVSYCPEAAIAAAEEASGAAEKASPSCPSTSRVGSVTIGAGPGSSPYFATGTAYLAGPYQGAPFSLVLITPAMAGPFDLGTAVVRAALEVDPETVQITGRSDPFPRILAGVPLRLRSIDIDLDRPQLTFNPTSCDRSAVGSTIHSVDGAASTPVVHFQAGACASLGFRPKLALSLSGGLGRNGHPALRADFQAGPGEAHLAATSFALPASELLDLHNVGALCARRLSADSCPGASRLGRARVWSPLLASPLEGSIYLRAPSTRLPDLLVDLRSGEAHVVLHGTTAASGGHLRIRFPGLPDVPFSKAVLTLAGERRGIFVNSEALCGRRRRAAVSLAAHNGKQLRLRPVIHLRGRC